MYIMHKVKKSPFVCCPVTSSAFQASCLSVVWYRHWATLCSLQIHICRQSFTVIKFH